MLRWTLPGWPKPTSGAWPLSAQADAEGRFDVRGLPAGQPVLGAVPAISLPGVDAGVWHDAGPVRVDAGR